MPANEYYDSTGAPSTDSALISSTIRAEFDSIEAGFNKLPTLAGNGGSLVFVNSGGSALESKTAAQALALLAAQGTAQKDASDGYVGLSLLKIKFKNALNTFTSYLTNSNTASRTYTFPDKDGTVALDSDILSSSQLTTLTGGGEAGSLHSHAHTVASHSDTTATGAELEQLTDGSNCDGLHVHAAVATVPVGTITAFVGGYFTDGANGGFTNVLGNTVSAVNSLLNASGWYVCNGAALNLPASSIFNGSGRYLPNLSDDRFINGDTVAGVTGGITSLTHTHAMTHYHATSSATLSTTQMPSHSHTFTIYGTEGIDAGGAVRRSDATGSSATFTTNTSGSGGSHSHGNTGGSSEGATGAASVTENRPLFLSCFYIMKVS